MPVSPQKAPLALGAVLAAVACLPTTALEDYETGGSGQAGVGAQSVGGQAGVGGRGTSGGGSASAGSGSLPDAGMAGSGSVLPDPPLDANLTPPDPTFDTRPDAGGADATAGLGAVQACTGNEGTTTFVAEGSCFLLDTQAVTWDDALSACQSWGGSLATLTSRQEETAVEAELGGTEVWIGYNDRDQEGTFVWASGETSDSGYDNWCQMPLQPALLTPGVEEDCVGKLVQSGDGWFDLQCSDLYAYLCERPL